MSIRSNHRFWRVVVVAALSALAGCGDDDNGSGGTGGSGGSSSNCAAACDNEVECNEIPRTVCEAVCNEALLIAEQISDQCVDAVNTVLACAGALSCTQYEAWQNEMPPDGFPCQAETEACDAECNDLCQQQFEL